ncbi:MAG: hypothetical protein HYY37_04125 [Candidatus Aenigmarchaeota archaeon]|nr:hypothetical protein [Candidatus Aenigmarchaeota archaeon]
MKGLSAMVVFTVLLVLTIVFAGIAAVVINSTATTGIESGEASTENVVRGIRDIRDAGQQAPGPGEQMQSGGLNASNTTD